MRWIAGGPQTLTELCDRPRGMLCIRWPQDFEAVLISAAEGSNLMDPASWAMTPPLAFDDAWLRGHGQPAAATAGYLEGDYVCAAMQLHGFAGQQRLMKPF